MSAETPGSPAPGPALEPELDPDPGKLFTLYQGPRSFRVTEDSTAIYSIMAPDTGRLHSILVKVVQMDIDFEAEAASTVAPGAAGLANLKAEPTSTVLASIVLATYSVCEVPGGSELAAARPPAKPNLASTADYLLAGGSRLAAARPPAKPDFLLARGALLACGTLALFLPTTDDLLSLSLPSIQLLAPNHAITSRSLILRCCVVWMDDV